MRLARPPEWDSLPDHLRRAAEFRLAAVDGYRDFSVGIELGQIVHTARAYVACVKTGQPKARISPTSLAAWLAIVAAGDVGGLAHPAKWHNDRRRERRRPRRAEGIDIPTASLAELAAIIGSVQRRLAQLAAETKTNKRS